jgi:hypothetical protein
VIVSKGVRVGTEFGEGEVVAVTKEWVVVNVGGKTGEVALHQQDAPVWVVPTKHQISGGDESFDAGELQDDHDLNR